MLDYPNTAFHDIGIFGQAGKFGLAYRNAESTYSEFAGGGSFDENLNQYSAGFGFGNQEAAAGVSMSLLEIANAGARWFPSVGIILRPDEYISLGAAYHNFSNAPFVDHPIEETTNIGVGIRPFGTDLLTLNGDLVTPIHNDGYKIGVTIQPIPGLEFYGIYDRFRIWHECSLGFP